MTTQRPMIAHVLHRLDLAGAEMLAAELARKLADRYQFTFYCLDALGHLGQQMRDEGFEVITLDRRPGVDLSVGRRLRKAMRQHEVNLVHAHQYAPFFYSAVSRRLRARPRILFTEHGREYPDVRRPRRVIANRLLLKPTDRVTAVAHYIRRLVADNEGIELDRISVIHNGIDPQHYVNADRIEARRRLNMDPQTPLVMQVARFHPVKDHATALQAFAHVAAAVPDARLALVGEGERLGQMQRLADELAIAHRVDFLGRRDDVPHILPAADVFLLSSLSEGISLTLLEAMACRLPIVATAVGGNVEVVEHGRNGLLVQRQDHAGLAHNLILLLRDAEVRRNMGEAGHKRLHRLFHHQQMIQAYDQLYQTMLR